MTDTLTLKKMDEVTALRQKVFELEVKLSQVKEQSAEFVQQLHTARAQIATLRSRIKA